MPGHSNLTTHRVRQEGQQQRELKGPRRSRREDEDVKRGRGRERGGEGGKEIRGHLWRGGTYCPLSRVGVPACPDQCPHQGRRDRTIASMVPTRLNPPMLRAGTTRLTPSAVLLSARGYGVGRPRVPV
eukprot:3459474-Rhodomonas_salina.1